MAEPSAPPRPGPGGAGPAGPAGGQRRRYYRPELDEEPGGGLLERFADGLAAPPARGGKRAGGAEAGARGRGRRRVTFREDALPAPGPAPPPAAAAVAAAAAAAEGAGAAEAPERGTKSLLAQAADARRTQAPMTEAEKQILEEREIMKQIEKQRAALKGVQELAGGVSPRRRPGRDSIPLPRCAGLTPNPPPNRRWSTPRRWRRGGSRRCACGG